MDTLIMCSDLQLPTSPINVNTTNANISADRNIIPINSSTHTLAIAPEDPYDYIDNRTYDARYTFYDYHTPYMDNERLLKFLRICGWRLVNEMAQAGAEDWDVYPKVDLLCERKRGQPIPNFSFGWHNLEPSEVRPRTYIDIKYALNVISDWNDEWTGRDASRVKGAKIDLFVNAPDGREVKTVEMYIQCGTRKPS